MRVLKRTHQRNTKKIPKNLTVNIAPLYKNSPSKPRRKGKERTLAASFQEGGYAPSSNEASVFFSIVLGLKIVPNL